MQTPPTSLRTPSWKAALLVVSAAVLGACGGGSGGGGGSVPAVTGIAVAPSTVTVQRGSAQQLTATATYDNGTQKDVTSQVQWTTSNAVIAVCACLTGTCRRIKAWAINMVAGLRLVRRMA